MFVVWQTDAPKGWRLDPKTFLWNFNYHIFVNAAVRSLTSAVAFGFQLETHSYFSVKHKNSYTQNVLLKFNKSPNVSSSEIN